MRWVCVPTGFEDGFEGRERRVHVAVVLGICLVVVAVLCPRNGIFLFFFVSFSPSHGITAWLHVSPLLM